MRVVYLISNEQREILINSVNDFIKFDPIQNANGSYLISSNEFYFILGLYYLDECPTDLIFIKDLTSSIHEPKPQTNLL